MLWLMRVEVENNGLSINSVLESKFHENTFSLLSSSIDISCLCLSVLSYVKGNLLKVLFLERENACKINSSLKNYVLSKLGQL